jgi:hypothetical protein
MIDTDPHHSGNSRKREKKLQENKNFKSASLYVRETDS